MSTQADFEKGLAFVLKAEGGYVNDPIGGPTNYGIRQTIYDAFLAKHGIASRSIQNITELERDSIYFYEYWLYGNCDLFPAKSAQVHFNTCVNCGVGEARILAQEALGVQNTGYFGPITLAAIKVANDNDLSNKYLGKILMHYDQLKNLGGQYTKDYQGWVNRTNNLNEWING